jgi:hypothetical protein
MFEDPYHVDIFVEVATSRWNVLWHWLIEGCHEQITEVLVTWSPPLEAPRLPKFPKGCDCCGSKRCRMNMHTHD